MQEQALPSSPQDLNEDQNITSPPISQSGIYHFKFHGKASEYFGIWIVNILLTIITLSLYAPWAKVRRLRYFYGNTEFFERRFDFTGIPTKILIGRLIALGIYAVFAISSQYSMIATVVGLVALYTAIPWLIRATLRFTARNSKFGNARFYFGGTIKESYKVFLLSILVYIFTLGIFTPVAIWLYKKYYLNNLYAGQLNFKLNAKWSAYMAAVYIPVFIAIGIIAIFFNHLLCHGRNNCWVLTERCSLRNSYGICIYWIIYLSINCCTYFYYDMEQYYSWKQSI